MTTFAVIIVKEKHKLLHPSNSTLILSFFLQPVKDAYFPLRQHKVFLVAHSIGGESMSDTIEERACELAVYMIETGATVRAAARHFGISKSTVHKDLSQRLPQCNRLLYQQVRQVLEINKQQRHIRGGLATRRKYKGE